MAQKNKNILLAGVAGLLIGFLALPIIQNFGVNLTVSVGAGIVAVLTLLTVAGMFIANALSLFLPIISQLARFVVVGVLNTLVDIGILNLLIYLSGAVLGTAYILFKSISFLVAVINSYVWNKYWTFESQKRESREIVPFVVVSLIGFGINVGIASLIANFVRAGSSQLMANAGALAGTILGLAWNFVGYKFFVFKPADAANGTV